jgi:hypothetical protein
MTQLHSTPVPRNPNTPLQKLGIRFHHVMEIRIGSPYRLCQIRWSGAWTPDLPTTDWQDWQVWQAAGHRVALVRWDTSDNQPGFRIVVIDDQMRTVDTSERFSGCCEALTWVGPDTLAWRAFPDQQGDYRTGRARQSDACR